MPHAPLPPVTPLGAGASLPEGEVVVAGIGVAPGVAMGPAYLYAGTPVHVVPDEAPAESAEAELARFEAAVQRSERELAKIVTISREKLGEASSRIFDAQQLILRDGAFYDAVCARIRDGAAAGPAVAAVMEDHRRRLEHSGNHALRERAADFLDIQNRVVRNLQRSRALSKIDPDRIVVAENLSAADLLLFSRRRMLGCVLDFGGPTSHVSIMARALGVPAVVSLHGLAALVEPGAFLIVDGYSGRVIVNPTEATRARYAAKQALSRRFEADREALAAAPAATADGHPVSLQANVEFREELPMLHEYGAEGVGLFRTEILFLTLGRALDEEQQLAVYRDTVRAAAPHPVTFRLIDLGGDKVMPLSRREANPFLGWRGIRILLDKPDLMRPQLRAILRAAAEGPVRLLLPMVSALDEVHAVRAAVAEVGAELAAEGLAHGTDVPLGIMVEVPAVALLAARFAAHVDFFSIGTNDLTQYTLAVDRGNDLVAGRYRELHPAVLALIRQTVKAGHAAGLSVSVCGEMAANPRITPLLVGLGVDALSASPAYLPLVKRVLQTMTCAEAQALAEAALAQPDATGVERLLDEYLAGHNADLAALLDPTPDP